MEKNRNTRFFKIAFWAGHSAVALLERFVPSFRDEKQNLYGFTNYYLAKFNLTNKERFKRHVKLSIMFSVSAASWVCLTVLFGDFSGLFKPESYLMILAAAFIAFIFLLIICMYVSYKISYRE